MGGLTLEPRHLLLVEEPTYAVMQQATQHVLTFRRPGEEKAHQGREELHLDSWERLGLHVLHKVFQHIRRIGNFFPVDPQEPNQRLLPLGNEGIKAGAHSLAVGKDRKW